MALATQTLDEALDLLWHTAKAQRESSGRTNDYRLMSNHQLGKALLQNAEELGVALAYDNDVEDKAADVLNFVAFLLHNHLAPINDDGGNAR